MNEKKGKSLQTNMLNNKYIEPNDDRYQLCLDVLYADDELVPLISFFDEEQYDTDAVYDDVQEKKQSNIYAYIEQNLNTKINQFSALTHVAEIYKPVIDAGYLLNYEQQNKTQFLIQFCGFTKSEADVAGIFLNATNWDMATSIDTYFMFGGDGSKIKVEQKKENENKQHVRRTSSKLEMLDLGGLDSGKQDVYTLGTKYWYWSSMKNQPNYIKPKHTNLKMELLYHEKIDCNVPLWCELDEECAVKLKSNTIQRMVSNGYNKNLYGIQSNTPFGVEHMKALLLYTNYTLWCSEFCKILREQKKGEIVSVANWARLLIECVQCYGELISSTTQEFYRGINKEFTFKKFVAAFNIPLSTTTSLMKAAEFAGFADESDGLVISLCDYDAINNVFAFDCCGISAFEEERETLFYGGDTILKIKTIWQLVDKKWMNYQNFVEATDLITRLMNGLSIKTAVSKSVKTAMRLILKNVLNSSMRATVQSLPKYIIDRLIKYHVTDRKRDVELYYDELTKCKWIQSIFFNQENGILNFYNICCIFKKCNKITVNMSENDANPLGIAFDNSIVAEDSKENKNAQLNKAFCSTLKTDLLTLSKDNISINTLQFNWLQVPLEVKFLITSLFDDDDSWKAECSSTSVILTSQEAKQDETKQSSEKIDQETRTLEIKDLTQQCLDIAQATLSRTFENIDTDLSDHLADLFGDDDDKVIKKKIKHNMDLMYTIIQKAITSANEIEHLRYLCCMIHYISVQDDPDLDKLSEWAVSIANLCDKLSLSLNFENNEIYIDSINLIQLNEFIEIEKCRHLILKHLANAFDSGINDTDKLNKSLSYISDSIEICAKTNYLIDVFNEMLQQVVNTIDSGSNITENVELLRLMQTGRLNKHKKDDIAYCYRLATNVCQKLNKFEKALHFITEGIFVKKNKLTDALRYQINQVEDPRLENSDEENDTDDFFDEDECIDDNKTEIDETAEKHENKFQISKTYSIDMELSDDIKRLVVLKDKPWDDMDSSEKLFYYVYHKLFGMILDREMTHSNVGNHKLAFYDAYVCTLLRPNNGTAWNNRAFAWYELDEYEKCIIDCNFALANLPKKEFKSPVTKALLHGNRGLSEYKLKLYHKAVTDLNICVASCNSRLAREALHSMWKEFTNAIYDGCKKIPIDALDSDESIDIPFVIAKIIADYAVGIDYEIIPQCHESSIVYG